MTTLASIHRASLLLIIVIIASLSSFCSAFQCAPSAFPSVGSRREASIMFGKFTYNEDERHHSRPNIVVINTHEQYIKFLEEEDDRVCVIKFYASWCKSCQRFGLSYRALAFEEGDRIDADGNVIHLGSARFAEVEYTAAAKLCKSLKVRKLPTVHMYKKGSGKVSDVTTKPSLFHLVVDELHHVLGSSDDEVETGTVVTTKNELKTNDDDSTSFSFDETMKAGTTLGNEIIKDLSTEKKKETNKEKRWFSFKDGI